MKLQDEGMLTTMSVLAWERSEHNRCNAVQGPRQWGRSGGSEDTGLIIG